MTTQKDWDEHVARRDSMSLDIWEAEGNQLIENYNHQNDNPIWLQWFGLLFSIVMYIGIPLGILWLLAKGFSCVINIYCLPWLR